MPDRCYPKERSMSPIGSHPPETVAVGTPKVTPEFPVYLRLSSKRRLHNAPAEGRGVLTALGRVLQQDRDGDGRRVGRRETDEPSVRRTGRVLGASGLA